MSHSYFDSDGGVMFYLLLALLHEDLSSGRIDFESYVENIVLLAADHERIKATLKVSKAA